MEARRRPTVFVSKWRAMRFPRWRKMTWLLLVFNVAMLIWVVAALSTVSDVSVTDQDRVQCQEEVQIGLYDNVDDCLSDLEAAADVGGGIGTFLILIVWFMGFVVLALTWFMTRPRASQESAPTSRPAQPPIGSGAGVPTPPASSVERDVDAGTIGETPKRAGPGRFCRFCGAALPAGSRFCENCGKPVGVPVASVDGGEASSAKGVAGGTHWLRGGRLIGLVILAFLLVSGAVAGVILGTSGRDSAASSVSAAQPGGGSTLGADAQTTTTSPTLLDRIQ